MGLLSNIGNALKKTVSTVVTAVMPTKAKIENVGAVLNAAFNPFSKDTVVANVQNKALKTTLETVANHPYVSAGVVAGGITLAANPSVATSVGTALIPTTTKGKVIAAVAAPVVIGAVVSQPAESAKAVISAPSNLANVGSNIATLIAEPTLEHAKDLIKENPIIVGSAIAAGTIAAGSVIIPAITSNRNIAAINEQTKAIQDSTTALLKDTEKDVVVKDTTLTTATTAAAPITPVTAQTQPIYATTGNAKTSTKRKRRSSKPTIQNFTQKTNVIVQNKNTSTGIKQTKRYLNKVPLFN